MQAFQNKSRKSWIRCTESRSVMGQTTANVKWERKYHGTSARRDRASCFRRACLSDPRTSFLSRGRLNRTLRTQAGHASVNLDGGHAAPDSLSVRRGGSHCARMPLRTKRSKSPSSCAAPLSVCLSPSPLPRRRGDLPLPPLSSKHPPPTPNGFTSHWPRTKRYRVTRAPCSAKGFVI